MTETASSPYGGVTRATKPLPDGDATYVLDVTDPSFGRVTNRIGLRG